MVVAAHDDLIVTLIIGTSRLSGLIGLFRDLAVILFIGLLGSFCDLVVILILGLSGSLLGLL